MRRRKKSFVSELRVQTAIQYDCGSKNDRELLDIVENVGEFRAVEWQGVGCCFLDCGFIIFQSERIPTLEEQNQLIESVEKAIKKLPK